MVDYYKKIEKIAGTMATVNRVIFTGQVRHEKIPLYLKAMDIVVIPLLSGRHARTTSPMKLFEYMAAGKAILASDVPSLRDYLNDNNSLLFGTDSDSLTHAIDRLIADRDLAVKIGSQARKDAQKYSWLNRARTIKDFVYE
jgi:glycosyltransferase involved in cell wall biosynthesis